MGATYLKSAEKKKKKKVTSVILNGNRNRESLQRDSQPAFTINDSTNSLYLDTVARSLSTTLPRNSVLLSSVSLSLPILKPKHTNLGPYKGGKHKGKE